MKHLILSLVLVPSYVLAQVQEMDTKEYGKKAISIVKDFEVQGMLEGTAEFNKCKEKAKFSDKDSPGTRESKVADAQACFKTEMSKQRDPEALKKLAESLRLESYGLIPSKNVNDIQNYLSNKMYKSLTGVDLEERDRTKLMNSMDFKNRKLVDQKVFIQLYKTQLGKNALMEISRFCFESFRNTDPTAKDAKDFATHWARTDYPIGQLTDVPSGGPFGNFQAATSKEDIYRNIFESIQGAGKKVDSFENFFGYCSQNIAPLCKVYEESVAKNPTGSDSKGANACLTLNKLREIKKALADSQKVSEDFDEMSKESVAVALGGGVAPKFYGKDSTEDESIFNLTSYTSKDVVEGGFSKDEQLEEKREKCAKQPELSDCEDFLSIGDDLEKVKHNYQLQMAMKKEVELARVREMVKNGKKGLKEYLEANGYYDILNDPEIMTNDASGKKLEEAIANSFEAKKKATMDALRSKVGSRQMSSKETDADKKKAITVNAEVSRDERARLGQVILFNNIITSYIRITKTEAGSKKKGEEGRNVQAWKKEQQSLEANKSIDKSVFANLEGSIKPDEGGISTKDSEIVDVGMLDGILGKKD